MRPSLTPHPRWGDPGGFHPPHGALGQARSGAPGRLTFDLFVQQPALPPAALPLAFWEQTP